jgi:LPXTG-site transpeptidase (sortase) family protein
MQQAQGRTSRFLPVALFAAALLTIVALASGVLVPKPISGPVPLAATPSAGPSVAAPNLPLDESPPVGESPATEGATAQRIVYPRLGIDLPIYDGDGETARLGLAAHYPTTGWPGSGTLVYLYGHARVGNFLPLWDAHVGDVVDLQLTGGREARYKVSRIVREVRWDDLSWLDPTPTELLRLQTCTSYGKTAPRFIVEAKPVPAS